MSFKTLARGAAWSLVAHILGRGSLVVASVLLARSLDTSGFAAYSYFQLTVSMLAAYSAMGMGTTATRFFAVTGHVPAAQVPPIGTLWLLSCISGGVLALAIMIMPTTWLNRGLDLPRSFLALGVFVTAIGVVPAGGLVGLERYRESARIALAAAIVIVVGTWLASQASSAVAAMGVFILASLVQVVGSAFVVVRNVGLPNLVSRSRSMNVAFQQIIEFAGPMAGVTLLTASGGWVVGQIILIGPSREQGFALYAIGLQWFSLALLFPSMISRVALPRLVRGKLDGSAIGGKQQSEIIRNSALSALIAAVIVSALGGSLSPWLWQIYDLNFSSGAWLIIAFLAAAVPAAPVNAFASAILANEGQRSWLLITCVWFACLIVLAASFSSLGVWSGAIAYGCAYLIMMLLIIKLAHRKGLI